ncbi:hypothetical protein JQ699_09030 [Francisella tularensis subsp. holarctica]|uniref:Uncharacterized protein n=1 Tax=Francisella tularensis subsp. holarctica (strain LVS) TaxID=376619 RepID=A0AAI8BHQ6_FRATH|nr:hypothetical protein AW21_1993 [Francisella tularensis subsp. holarctica LVS]AJI64806.1 hypothetical protein CH67_1433 [Francisella tularensis subsp. holarctica]MBD2807651.1 hypothetical protein [Francisella tularensis]MBD1309651.1 hypothetical protein [Francisella tularensis subsp. holarctica]MBD5782820.1 hypothetical protein [Francisella tularensis subsp. holarctica]
MYNPDKSGVFKTFLLKKIIVTAGKVEPTALIVYVINRNIPSPSKCLI